MSSSQRSTPGDETQSSTNLQICCADVANTGPFMDSLVTFLNEAAVFMQGVKLGAGFSPGCSSQIPMNDDEKKEKLCSILGVLTDSCQKELCKKKSPASSEELRKKLKHAAKKAAKQQARSPQSCSTMQNSSSFNNDYNNSSSSRPQQYSVSPYTQSSRSQRNYATPSNRTSPSKTANYTTYPPVDSNYSMMMEDCYSACPQNYASYRS